MGSEDESTTSESGEEHSRTDGRDEPSSDSAASFDDQWRAIIEDDPADAAVVAGAPSEEGDEAVDDRASSTAELVGEDAATATMKRLEEASTPAVGTPAKPRRRRRPATPPPPPPASGKRPAADRSSTALRPERQEPDLAALLREYRRAGAAVSAAPMPISEGYPSTVQVMGRGKERTLLAVIAMLLATNAYLLYALREAGTTPPAQVAAASVAADSIVVPPPPPPVPGPVPAVPAVPGSGPGVVVPAPEPADIVVERAVANEPSGDGETEPVEIFDPPARPRRAKRPKKKLEPKPEPKPEPMAAADESTVPKAPPATTEPIPDPGAGPSSKPNPEPVETEPKSKPKPMPEATEDR